MRHLDNGLDLSLMRVVSIRLAFVAAIFGLTATLHAQIPASEHRLWTVDLVVVPLYNQLKAHGSEVAEAGSVVFVDANTVAITYRFADPASGQATDAVSFFDAGSGTLQDSLQWSSKDRFPANRNFVRVLPTRDREFLVMVGRSLTHYSASHKELNSRPLPYGDNNEWEWIVKVAPDGKIALMKRFGPGENADHWISAATLNDRAITPAPFYQYGYEVGQEFVLYSTSGSGSEARSQIRIHASTGQDRILCKECQGANFGVLRDRIFFGGLPAGTGVLASTDGRVLLKRAFGRKNQPISEVSVARESTEIALYMSYLQGKNSIGRIVVFDTDKMQEVRRLDFEDPGEDVGGGGRRFLRPVVAISPDGSKLAIFWRSETTERQPRLEVFPLVRR